MKNSPSGFFMAINSRKNLIDIKSNGFLASIFTIVSIFSFASSQAQSYNLHWGSAAWTAGSFSKTITNINGSGIDAAVTINSSNALGNVSTASTTGIDQFIYSTPKVGVANVAWFLPGTTGPNPLVQYVDWSTINDRVTTTITFSQPITNVSFYLGDMDRASPLTYVDRVTFTGSLNGTLVPNPIVTKFQATKAIAGVATDTVLINGNTAYGNSAGAGANINAGTSSIETQGATILVKFSNQITQLTFVWDEGPGAVVGDPNQQAYVIGDIAFSKVIQKYPYPPTADNYINTPMPQGNAATLIPNLTASDIDGTISTYTITTIPLASEGELSYCSNGTNPCTGAETIITANTVLTPAQMATLKFNPAPNFIGTAAFNFTAKDDDGNVSNTAIYKLPVVALPPMSNNIMENSMPNTNGATKIQGLSSTDVDGSIASYQITKLPLTTAGVLSIPCPVTLSGATCTGGYQDLTAAILASYPLGLPLDANQMAAMKFAPASGYVGNVTFNYNALDNSGNVSNTANYTIPVSATATPVKPPLADNICAQPLNNSLGNNSIPTLQANDLDGSITSFTISSLPLASTGVLRISCPTTPSGLTCVGGYADVITGTVLTPVEAARLYFDPAPGFMGTGSFTYAALDNSGLISNTATYNLPVTNTPPVAANINTLIAYNALPTALPALSGSDADGTIAGFTITSVPPASQGTISIPCPVTPAGATCVGGFANLTAAVLAANPSGITLTAVQAAAVRFAPTAGFSGVTLFNYTTTDNNGLVSAPANSSIVVPIQPPVTTDVTNAIIANSAAATAISVLNGTDVDGTIASYTIFSIPSAGQGILSIPCPATPAGATCTGGFANLTQAVMDANLNGITLTPAQAIALRFDPTAGYSGVAAFKFGAVDNAGLLSNVSTYSIPVSGAVNIPPVAKNILAPSMSNLNGATAIPTLIGTDADGTIASFTLSSVPSATQGTLSIPCPATPAGATCFLGFADLTPAVLAANPTGIVLTAVQAAGMRFDPLPGFSGNVDFTYITTDNSGNRSAGVVYTIPVTSLAPSSNAVVAPTMSQADGATVIPGLVASDPDGTIASYSMETLPPVSQGVISIPCPVTPTGATCTGGFADLTAAVLANYPAGGIPVTPAQMAAMRFDPAPGYSGNVVFNYHATDNSALISNTSSYTIPVINLVPKSENVVAPKINAGSGPTSIPTLNGNDADGVISSYLITSVPPTSQGVMSIPCPATPNGAVCTGGFADLTAAVLAANPGGIIITPAQAAAMRFDVVSGNLGTIMFNYAAIDNNGNISNVATYSIPTSPASVLAISNLQFSAQRKDNDIVASWKTENEVNVDHFEIEYSTDNNTYIKGGMVSANNSTTNNYSFTLVNYTQPIYYIRLNSIDKDSKSIYSNIIKVIMNGKFIKTIAVSPNPVSDVMNIKISSDIATIADVKVINNLGQVIYKQSTKLIKGENAISINNLGNIAKGIYTLQVLVENEIISTKVLKN
jgi:Secretion system C-terminal sorting domain